MSDETVGAAAAGTWRLGDLTVNRLGFGAMRLTSTADGRPSDGARAIGVLRRAVELGVDHIDTASFYVSDLRSANELINSALGGPYPDNLVITTKVGPGKDANGEWTPAARPDQLRGQVEENLRQLGRDHLDVVNLRVHAADSVAERFGVLAELRGAGLIRHLGVSNVRAHQLAEAMAIAPVVCVQNRYGLGIRGDDELLAECGRLGIAFVPFFAIVGSRTAAIGAGGGTAAPGEEAEVVGEVARAHGASPAQIRLAWTLHRGPHVLAIPGTGDPDHLEANIAAGAIRLSPAELARLDGLGALAG
ncbi:MULTISPECIES: aldo/keto reductase [unclassified Streptomyces]|uniref:aldo/keto reductase n=1 Tax=unclassified Streptomyces TaxID=2593676 RepID=UPI000B833DD1|nr:aldo/keto reductase [Streptomyces sp. DvalAA-14]MYS23361.1 aldo/keto reductase [Streptomyces sp. SID4948]